MFSFSKPRLISIGLLLAILLISLMIPSYIEGLSPDDEIIANVNENAPANKNSGKTAGITLGKNLTVDDITGALQNNSGVQKMLDKPL